MNRLLKITFALLVVSMTGATSLPAASNAQVLLVSNPSDASWQDFAVLAGVPASRQANQGNGALIALDENGVIPREVADYLSRLKPAATFHVGSKPLSTSPKFGKHVELLCASAEEAASVLATTFWQESRHMVVCRDDDYASALMASALAGRLSAPLLYTSDQGLSERVVAAAKQLKVREMLFVGTPPVGMDGTALRNCESVLKWLKSEGMETPYLAVTNVRDRSSARVRKLSLVAPMFAAAREGMVVPIDKEFQWREAVNGKVIKGELPKGIAVGTKPPHAGEIKLAEGKLSYVLGFGPGKEDQNLWLDLNHDGAYDGKGEGPFQRNGVFTLLGKARTLDFNQRFGNPCDLTVTTGNVDDVTGPLSALYQKTGVPHYLCLVGFPDCIPMEIINHRKSDLSSDYTYSNTDADWFAEIAVGRIIAENATYATLHASRTLTYEQLLDPSWSGRAGQARWENTMSQSFQNVGLDASAYHDKQDRPWIEKPKGKKKGKRQKSFARDSPLTSVAFLSHMAHSWWKELGETYHFDSQTLLAPTVVESGGCLTGDLDCEPDFRSVISRLFRNGAVSFCGQTRPGIAQQEQQRVEYWNGMFAGMTIGEAFRHGQNSKAALVVETDQVRGGSDRYQLHIRTLFGDPAFKPRLPSVPRSGPAKAELKGDLVTVHAPESWWITRIRVPEDWKLWAEKPLYVIRGLGTYPNRRWCKDQYDLETINMDVELPTSRRIKSIKQVQTLPAPLGRTGKFTVDQHADGTRTYHWRVRLIDFDQTTGKIVNQADRIEYRIEYVD